MTKKYSILALILICGFTSLGLFNFKEKRNALAVVEKDYISAAELETRIKTYPNQYQASLQQKENKIKILDQMIDELVIFNAAKDQGYTKNPTFKEQMELAEQKLLINLLIRDKVDSKITLTEADLQDYYAKNKERFKGIESRRVQHILVKTKKEAYQIANQIKTGSSFDQLAEKKSIDPTSKNQGDIGWFTNGQLKPEFEKAAFALGKIGEVSPIVETDLGFHIIKLTDKSDYLVYELARRQIQEPIVQEKRQILTGELITQLKKDMKIEKRLDKLDPVKTESAKK